MGTGEFLKFVIPAEKAGQRLDIFLVDMVPALSRSRVSSLIRNGSIVVNGKSSKAAHRLKSDEQIEVTIPPPQPMDIEPEKVDFAVIETGLGGRLDSTNVLSPVLSVITNIGYDHTQFLGTTLPAIASEKAGIIKEKTPVVIGQTDYETAPVFIQVSEPVEAIELPKQPAYDILTNFVDVEVPH